jgi:hypothetical protein
VLGGLRVEDDRLGARRSDVDGDDEVLVSGGLGHPGQYSRLRPATSQTHAGRGGLKSASVTLMQ